SDRSYYPGAILPDQTLGVIVSFKWLARDDFKWLAPEHAISTLAPLVGVGIVVLVGGTALWIVRQRDWRPVIYGLAMALLPTLMIAVVVLFRPKLAGRYAWPAWLGIDLLLSCGLLAISPYPLTPSPLYGGKGNHAKRWDSGRSALGIRKAKPLMRSVA